MQTVLMIETDEGVTGYYFGGGSHGDQEGLNVVDQHMILGRIRSAARRPGSARPRDDLEVDVGRQHPRERCRASSTTDAVGPRRAGRRHAGLQADGRRPGQGQGLRLTYPNIGEPRVYAEHALACKNEGYLAYKIHPHYFWDPETEKPTPGRPSNIKAEDIETIHLVREAVGPDYRADVRPLGHLS